ncbi:MAG TPA: hypothetical protein VJW73_10915 [Gemmatimonadaceae bacterium]|nr:hypothetical protein [Gemmatimonadaceae bacterium]
MKRLIVLCLSFAVSGSALAQVSSACPAGTATAGIPDQNRATQDACQQAIDLFQFMAPQLGIAITGGNATLGQGGSLGGLGHFVVEARVNALAGNVPQIQTPSTNGAQQRSNYPTKTQILGLPSVDGSLGLFKGLPLGLTNVGGVDLLLSAFYVPKVSADNVTVDPDSPLKIGYGLRVSALQESLLVPGVSFTILRRDLPKTTITGTSGGDSLIVRGLEDNTTAWRLVASKSLVLFGLAAGVGQDRYDAKANIQGVVSGVFGPLTNPRSNVIPLSQKVTRTNYFADVSLNMLLAKIVGEIGMVSGGNISTGANKFDTAPDKSRLYGSLGIRLGF